MSYLSTNKTIQANNYDMLLIINKLELIIREHEPLDFIKWHIPHMNQLSMLTWMSICTKMKTNRVHTSLSPQSSCRRSSLLPFTCVA